MDPPLAAMFLWLERSVWKNNCILLLYIHNYYYIYIPLQKVFKCVGVGDYIIDDIMMMSFPHGDHKGFTFQQQLRGRVGYVFMKGFI